MLFSTVRITIFVLLLLITLILVKDSSAFGIITPKIPSSNYHHNSFSSGNKYDATATTRSGSNINENNKKQQKQHFSMFGNRNIQQVNDLCQVRLCMLSSSSSNTEESTTNTNTNSNKRRVQIIIAGAPASGKGTQCEIIKLQYGCVHLSTGDILREAVTNQTPVGIIAKEYMDSGQLVPDNIIIDIVQDRIQQQDCVENGWLLDGFPRTNEQAKSLVELNIIPDVFIFLNVPDNILVERVIGRRTDSETGIIYHMTYKPPPTTIPMERLVHRSDDTAEKIIVRLQQFNTNVNAVKDNYSNCTITIDGNQNPSIVSETIITAINKKLNIL